MEEIKKASKIIKLRSKTETRPLLEVICFMLAIILVFLITRNLNGIKFNSEMKDKRFSVNSWFSILDNEVPETEFNTATGRYKIDLKANDTSFISNLYLSDHWVLIPNVTPNNVRTLGITSDPKSYKDLPHAVNVSLNDVSLGWRSIGKNAQWRSLKKSAPKYYNYYYDGIKKGSVAYLIGLETSAATKSVTLTLPSLNGTAYIYCNDKKTLGTIGYDNDNVVNLGLNDGSTNSILLTPVDGKIDLMIIVTCDSRIYNPGITSYPIIQNNIAATRSIIASNTWYFINIMLILLAVIGCLLIMRTFNSKLKSYVFIAVAVTYLIFFSIDENYISFSPLYDTILRYNLIILMGLFMYIFTYAVFKGSKINNEHQFLNYDWFIPTFFAVIGLTAITFNPSILSTWVPRAFTLLFASLCGITSFAKAMIYYFHERHTRFAMCFNFTGIMCSLQMLEHETSKYNIPSYSTIIMTGIMSLELFFIFDYIRNHNEVTNMTVFLEQQVKEKTRYIYEINRDLIAKNKKLIEGEEARKTVLSNVSHDLRTPITAIRGYTELIMSAGDRMTPEQREGYLTNIHRRTEQMERIVSDIVELTRMESNTNEFHFADISMSELLDEIIMMYQADLNGTTKELTLDLPDNDLLIARADAKKISRVFENLISNAINYSKEEALIKVKAWRSNTDLPIPEQRINITVSDNGIGIPEGEIDKIFDRFYRAKNSGQNIKGTGLGLSITKLIIDKHDAEIKVTSQIGIGTTFHVIMKATY